MSYVLQPSEVSCFAINIAGAMQKDEELTRLLNLVQSKPHSIILEIGVGKGGTSWCWTRLESRVIAIDLVGGPWGGGPTPDIIEYTKASARGSYTFIDGDSKNPETLRKVHEAIGKQLFINFLFIDGDHSYEGVKRDYEIYSPLVQKGGMIAFHDICSHPPESGCEVKKFWDEVKVGKNVMEIIHEPTNWGGIGVILL